MTASAQFLRMQKLTGKGVVGVAARHNHREILAEMGGTPGCSIDPRRTPLNRVLAGAGDAAGVVAKAQALMSAAGLGTLRKDAVRALEIVVSLPSDTSVDQDAFFTDAVRWAAAAIGAPVLSAVVHNDEAAPHAHILILPLVDGRMVGSDLMGNRAKLQALQADFQLKVAHRYGLARQATPARPNAAQRREAVDMAFAALETNSGLQMAVLLALLEPHRADPLPLLQVLGIAMPAPKRKAKASFVEIMTRPAPEKKPIGFANRKPIGFDADADGAPSQTLSCVGFGDFHDPNFADRQPTQGAQNSLHTSAPNAPVDTPLRFQEARASSADLLEAQETQAAAGADLATSVPQGGVGKIYDTPGGLHKIEDTPQAVGDHRPGADDMSSFARISSAPANTSPAPCVNGMRPHKDVSKSGCISKGGGISPPPAGVPKFGDTPIASIDLLKTQQVDQQAGQADAHRCSPAGGGHPSPQRGGGAGSGGRLPPPPRRRAAGRNLVR